MTTNGVVQASAAPQPDATEQTSAQAGANLSLCLSLITQYSIQKDS